RSVRGLSNVGWLNGVYFDWTGRKRAEQASRWGSEKVKGQVGPARSHVLTSSRAHVHTADAANPPRGPLPLGGGARGAAFGRWGGWGDHRHPVHFSGDVHSGWRALAFVVEFTIRSSHAGCFFWSHDIGGHFGARDEEAMTRWTQFGAFSAAMRV